MSTTINTVVGIMGIIVGIIGIIVGIVGAQSLSAAQKIKNSIRADGGSVVTQTQIYQQGVSEDTIRLIAKDMTKEQMCRLLIHLIPINTDDPDCLGSQLRRGNISTDQFEELISALPNTYYGQKAPPIPSKKGDIWYRQQ